MRNRLITMLSVVQESSSNIHSYPASLARLTKREQECLLLFLNGYTAKETAQVLNLSYRTIEEHLEKLKVKLGCRYKRNLHALFPHTLPEAFI